MRFSRQQSNRYDVLRAQDDTEDVSLLIFEFFLFFSCYPPKGTAPSYCVKDNDCGSRS